MKLLSLLLLLPLSGFAYDLMPKDSAECSAFNNGATIECREGTMYTDEEGNCGCLRSDQLLIPSVCHRVFIKCHEEGGQVFRSLYKVQPVASSYEKIYQGCGCYTIGR